MIIGCARVIWVGRCLFLALGEDSLAPEDNSAWRSFEVWSRIQKKIGAQKGAAQGAPGGDPGGCQRFCFSGDDSDHEWSGMQKNTLRRKAANCFQAHLPDEGLNKNDLNQGGSTW